MSLDTILVGLVILLCLALEGFFAGSELAMVACDKLRLRQRAMGGSRGARVAEWLLSKPSRLFSITLLGTNFATVMASTVLTFYLIQNYGPAYGSFAILLSPVILVFAEILPKSVFHHHAERLVDRVAPLLTLFGSVSAPVVLVLQRLTERLLGGVRKAAGSEKRITREELALLLQGDEVRGGDIRPSERTMVARALRLAELRAKNVMIPLVAIDTLPVTASRDAALRILTARGMSLIPVFSHRVFDIVGILDAVDVLCAEPDAPLRTLIHQPVYVPEEMRLHELFRVLRERKETAAVVVDEYGGAMGIVTLEEICEEVVGDIRDEFERDVPLYREIGPQHYQVSARLEIEEAQALGLEIPPGDYETIGGMLLARFGRIPRVGERLTIGRWQYEIRQATERNVVEVDVHLHTQP